MSNDSVSTPSHVCPPHAGTHPHQARQHVESRRGTVFLTTSRLTATLAMMLETRRLFDDDYNLAAPPISRLDS